jgi:hypothetical protein
MSVRAVRLRRPAGLAAREFGHVRGFFCGVMDEPVVNASERVMKPNSKSTDYELLGEVQVHHDLGTSRDEFDGEIAVRDRIHAVLANSAEPKLLRNVPPVDWQHGAGQRPRAEGQYVYPAEAVLQSSAVAFKHFIVGKQMVAQEHRLRPLQVRITRQHHVAVPVRKSHKLLLECAQEIVDSQDFIAQVHAQIEGYLVVPAASRMKLAAHRPDLFDEPVLDVHMDVLELDAERKGAGGDFFQIANPRMMLGLLFRDDAGPGVSR